MNITRLGALSVVAFLAVSVVSLSHAAVALRRASRLARRLVAPGRGGGSAPESASLMTRSAAEERQLMQCSFIGNRLAVPRCST
ncbi:MAG TPA: hypothetical protein VED59_02685 [Acidimicrobiales bacterium]|nr:hypothetical protein [Acidimicrobiales bacterium]